MSDELAAARARLRSGTDDERIGGNFLGGQKLRDLECLARNDLAEHDQTPITAALNTQLAKLAGDVAELQAKLAAIEALCRRYNSPAVNTGAHGLAGKVLRLIEGDKSDG